MVSLVYIFLSKKWATIPNNNKSLLEDRRPSIKANTNIAVFGSNKCIIQMIIFFL